MPGRRISLLAVKRAVTAAVVLAVLAGVSIVLWDWYAERRSRCADGVTRMEATGECVGVTDGSHVFEGHLKEVTEKIAAENEKLVESGEPYVSIAYMTSFTLRGSDSNSKESVRHELQGAYLAQYRGNRGDLRGVPRVRLLIANVGSESRYWEHTVRELVARKEKERLVAVTGLGPSTTRNLAALRELSEQGLATVAGAMTATSIGDEEGFVRVAPTNRDEARAAARYLRRERIATAVVVKDAARHNLYAETLSEDFAAEFPRKGRHELVTEARTFDSSKAAWETELAFIAQQLCHHEPAAVYFAGRGKHLTHFLDRLANRPCTDWNVTVMTGDDTTNLTKEQLTDAARSGIRVLYTGLAHPDMWSDHPDRVSQPSIRAFREGDLMDRWFPSDRHGDGQAMMAHDAVLTAAVGAQMAAGGESEVTGETVGTMFRQMHGEQRVPGTSGFLSFRNDGNPAERAVPILELRPDGNPVFVEVVFPRG
ncbi:branched-chain amino acid ABC transporter substrate-binding protein [Streptomyces macrosporus]|uniref:ABC transporter substrate-binding protein n=1 Tax=Streptomyces macrosporus TaxID=44032 RepID=A0ABP5WWK7_9ACTN